jgi:predicted Zn-dependent protease
MQALEEAILALRSQRPDVAEGLAGKILRLEPDNLLAAQLLGEALLVQHRPAEAIEVLEKHVGRKADAPTETLLGMAFEAAGRLDEALLVYQRATTRRPVFPLAFHRLAQQLGETGRLAEAIALIKSGLALTPKRDAAALKLALGQLYLRGNDLDKARPVLSELVAEAPSAAALSALARVMSSDGDFAAAASLYQRALDLRPDDGLMRIAVGKCLLELGDRRNGEASLRAAVLGDSHLLGTAIEAMAATPHGRFFLRTGDAAKYLEAALG